MAHFSDDVSQELFDKLSPRDQESLEKAMDILVILRDGYDLPDHLVGAVLISQSLHASASLPLISLCDTISMNAEHTKQ